MEEEDAIFKIQAQEAERKQETRRRRRSITKSEEATSEAQQTEREQEIRRRNTVKPLKATFKKAAGRLISRCTRSQVAPKWTKKETLILLNEIACQDHELAKALPSNQRWKIVAEGCGRMNVNRSSNDCKRRWDSLITEHNKIHVWENSESFSKLGSYWSLESSKRKKFQLPSSFDKGVFGAIEGVIEVQEALSGSKEPVQVSGEVENDKDSVDTNVNDDSDVSYDSDDDSERTTTETESSDLNVQQIRSRATKGEEEMAAEMLDTEMTCASLDTESEADFDTEAEAEAEAKADVDAEAVVGADTVADAEAVADADTDAVTGADDVADANAEAVAGAGADAGAVTDAVAVAVADADADADADAEAVAGAVACADADAVAVTDADAVTVADADAAAGADAVADADANADVGAYADAVAGAYADTNADVDSGKKEIEATKVYSKEQEMASKLRENAKQIHAIIKGDLPDEVSKSQSQTELTKSNAVESEFVERQAGELIKSFEVLVSNLNQFKILINEGSCEGINFIKPIGR